MRAWFRVYLWCISLSIGLYGVSSDTLTPLTPSHTLKNIDIKQDIQEDQMQPQEGIDVKLDTYSQDGYSALELNNKSFKENEIEAALWRAGVGYRAYYRFRPAKDLLINFHFGTSIEITQNRLGGKTKTYNDEMFNEEHAYDWGFRVMQSGSVSNIGVTISIAGKHNIQITIRQLFLDNVALLKRYASGSSLVDGIPWVSAQNQLTSATNALFNNTQILASYSLYF